MDKVNTTSQNVIKPKSNAFFRTIFLILAFFSIVGCKTSAPAKSTNEQVIILRQELHPNMLAFVKRTTDKNWEQRLRALNILGSLKIKPPSLQKTFVQALSDPEEVVRANGMFGLARMGRAAHKSLSRIQAAANDFSWQVRRLAVLATYKIEPNQQKVIENLKKHLKDPHPAVRTYAVYVTYWLKNGGHSLFPQLIELLNDPHSFVSSSASRILLSSGKSAYPALEQALSHKKLLIRFKVFRLLLKLSQMHKDSKTSIKTIRKGFQDKSQTIYHICFRKLIASKELALKLRPELALLLRKKGIATSWKRRKIIGLLEKMGSDASSVIPELKLMLEEENPTKLHQKAARLLLKLLPKDDQESREKAKNLLKQKFQKNGLFGRGILGGLRKANVNTLEVTGIKVTERTSKKTIQKMLAKSYFPYLANCLSAKYSKDKSLQMEGSITNFLQLDRMGRLLTWKILKKSGLGKKAMKCFQDHIWYWSFPSRYKQYSYIQLTLKVKPPTMN